MIQLKSALEGPGVTKPGLGRVAISCCSMVTSTKLGLFEVTWRMYGGSVANVVILAIEVGVAVVGGVFPAGGGIKG